jgi:hypothetical protein
MAETSSSTTVSTKLERIAKLAHEMPQAALTTLAHHIDIDWLREAYRRTRKDGATGVDRQTADEYARNLDENLRLLLERAKSGSYVAPPVRRVHIPKAGDGSQTRPIGIPNDVCAAQCERTHRFEADARGATRDENRFPFEVEPCQHLVSG